MPFKFTGIIGSEDELTGDGRMIRPDALRFETPMPLQFVRSASGGHDGSVTVGKFTSIERVGNDIIGSGEFLDVDADEMPQLAEDVKTAIFLVESGAAPGISMDLAEVTAELHMAKKFFEDEPEILGDEDGDTVKVADFAPDDQIMVFTDALVRAATLVSIPAFKNANIIVEADDDALASLVDEFEDINVDYDADCGCTLTAAAPPAEVPSEWFLPRDFSEPTPIYSDNGRVFGHIALWDTCHTGMPGVCTTPPRDPSGEYRAFHQSRINTTDGVVNVGVLTVGGGHADPRLGARAAIEHYDDVATVWAYVRAYEDEHGIAVAGVLADDVEDKTLATALAHPVSGDWRNLGAGLELVACCSVNTPGFPVLAASAGVQTSLVAAGVEVDSTPAAAPTVEQLTEAFISAMEAREAKKDLAAEAERLAAEVAEIEAAALYADVHK